MAVAADRDASIEPDLDRARELAREANVIPVSFRFVDDCETPVSAFLKLREAFPGPSFLLESAEQGRLGRYSFLGFRPRVELRWADGELTEARDGELVKSAVAEGAAVGHTVHSVGWLGSKMLSCAYMRSRSATSNSSVSSWSERWTSSESVPGA